MIRTLLRWLGHLAFAFALISFALVTLYHYVDPPITPLMLIRAIEGQLDGHPVGIERHWVDLQEVSPALLRAVIAAEDARFFQHWGVDAKEIRHARAYNARQHDGRLRGGSTITMQCARSVLLWPSRTYLRKALEVYLAILLEQLWGKRRILEVYVNVVEWGAGIYGVEAAAQHYFGVSAARLDAERAALLAAALPAPRREDPGVPSPYLRRRAAIIAARAKLVDLAAARGRGLAPESGR